MSAFANLQRALLRMQLDDDFAERLLAGEDEAVRSSGLGGEELALLAAVDSRAISADREGARRGQVIGNASRELALTTSLAEVLHPEARFLEGFSRSPELHEALAGTGRLPVAYADYALRRAEELGDALLAALATLEGTLVRARRGPRPETRIPGQDEVALSARAWLCELQGGTFEYAQALRAAFDAGATRLPEPPRACETAAERETVLVLAKAKKSSWRPPELHVERLATAPAAVLGAAAVAPLDHSQRHALAERFEVTPDQVDLFIEEMVGEGALVEG